MARYPGQRELVLLTSIALTPPLAAAAPDTPAPLPADQVWGDPENTDERRSGWTWFGMGFESRRRQLDPQLERFGPGSRPGGGFGAAPGNGNRGGRGH